LHGRLGEAISAKSIADQCRRSSTSPDPPAMMSRRKRKLIGTILLVVLVPAYAMIMVELSRYLLAGAGWFTQLVFFVIAGFIWALPVLPLIRWMERLSPDEAEARREG
jgi:hypothetical protein